MMVYGLPSTTITALARRVRVSIDCIAHGRVSKVIAAKAPGLVLVDLVVGTDRTMFGDGVTLEHGLTLDFPEHERPRAVQGFPLSAEFTNTTPSAIAVVGFGFVVVTNASAPVVDVDDEPACAQCKHPERYHSAQFSSDASRFRCTFLGCPCVRVER